MLDQIHRDIIPSGLMCDNPEQVQCISVVGLLGENLFIQNFGLRKLSRLMRW